MHPSFQAGSVPPSRRRRHWSRKKKIAITMVILMILTPFMAAGFYVWNTIQAIEGAQDSAVVSLPTSSLQLGGVSQKDEDEPTETAPSADAQATPSDPSDAPEPTATVGPQPTNETEKPTENKSNSGNSNPSSVGIARDLIGTGTRTDVVKPGEVWPGKDYINILVLGVDTRETEGDQNADVIMIARLDFRTSEVRVVSIPRDLQVEVPGYGLSKINGAYNIGIKENPENEVAGVIKMRDTIEYNFGVPIDEFVLVDFKGFEKVIDSVGGITINVPERIEDDAYPTEDFGTTTLVIEAGKQDMDGETALAYARTRHQDSDDKRRERQMLVLRALLDKAQSIGSVTRITQVISAGGDAVMTSINWNKQLALVGVALKLDQDKIVMQNVAEPLVTPGTSENGAWIYVGDPDEIGNFIESVLDGTYEGE